VSAPRLVVAVALFLVTGAHAAKKPRALIDQFYEALGNKDREKVAKLGDQLLAGDPRNITLLQMLVRIHAESHDWPRTIDCAGRCLKIQPWNANCLHLLAHAHHEIQKYDEEIADLTALSKMPGREADALGARARTHRSKGELYQASADYRAVLADRANDQRALWGLVEIAVWGWSSTSFGAGLLTRSICIHPPDTFVAG
jgi:tetratricopeptide (TPR) repeat protein